MLYQMGRQGDSKHIAQYGKAYGTVLLHEWLPEISKTKNLFVLDSYDEFKKIEAELPEVFTCRADAKTGEPATLGVEGNFVRKEEVEDYIKRVKQSNPNGVVLCIDTEEGTQEKVKADGAFNVYFNICDKIYIDFLGKGFDMGAITKGKENHETWLFDWNDILFVTPNNMNKFRQHVISDEDYLNSARRRLQHLINIGYSPESIKGKIPRNYSPMPPSIKEMLLEKIILPLYCKQGQLAEAGLRSFGVQGMIINHELFPIEFNREVRFADKSLLHKKNTGFEIGD